MNPSSDGSAEINPESKSRKLAQLSSFERSKHEAYDDRVAKAQGKYDDNLTESPPIATPSPSTHLSPAPDGFPPDLPPPEPISAANAKAGQSLERFAGEYVAQCFYSKNWHLREASLVYLQSNLDRLLQPGQERENFRLMSQVVVKGLKDKVANVFLTSTSLIQSIVSGSAVNAKDLQFATNEFVPILIDKLGETNPRIKDAAHESIMTLANLKDSGVKNLTHMFLVPLKKQAAWRPVLGRLEIISELVDLIGIGKSATGGFDLDATMQFVAKAFTSPNADTRSAAIGVTVKVARLVGPLVKRYIAEDVNPKVREQLDLEISTALNGPGSQTTPTKPQRNLTKRDIRTPTSGSLSVVAQLADDLCVGSPQSPGSLTIQSEGDDPTVFELELQKQEQILGTDHPDLAEVLTNLAAVYTQREEFDLAYPLLKRVLDINESHFGSEHSNVAHALTDLAVLHMEQVTHV